MTLPKLNYKHWLVLPAIIAMLAVLIFPLIFSVRTSLFYYVLTNPSYRPFYGIKNYIEMVNPQMLNSLWVTFKFSVGSVLLELLAGFILAYALTRIAHFKNVFISILLAPMMITPIAVGLIWRLLLHPDLGVINYFISQIGLTPKPWLGLESTALLTLIFIDAWQWTPFLMILLYAGLISLPVETFEAAVIDGANAWHQIRYVTLPMMRNVIVIAVTIRLIDSLRAYDLVYMMTRGGPGTSTETFSYYVFRLAFTGLNLGQAAAVSLTYLIAVSFLTSFLFNRLSRID
ncbi:MAG: sugar ABC transporter permease [Anaerolineales bacterium]|nr:sugar ABC transporter permease [Anaerolineales bacterium]